MDGSILDFIIRMTGLPTEEVTHWLQREVNDRGLNWDKVSEKELRTLLADILEASVKRQAELN
jgi:hypothetical protein